MDKDSSGKDVVTIQLVGGSLQVSLPFEYVRHSGAKKGDKMAVHFVEDRITYKPLLIEDIEPVETKVSVLHQPVG